MDEAARFRNIKLTGCLPCLLDGLPDAHTEIHHVVEQAYRRGDRFTYGACQWHHRGIPWPKLRPDDMLDILGPSLELNYKQYRQRYGSELTLVQVQDYMLHLFATEPWGDYAVPRATARKIRQFWKDAKSRD